MENNLLNPNRFISKTHEIYAPFDANPSLKVIGVYLDISEAFDGVWYEGLKIKLMDVKDDLLSNFDRIILNHSGAEDG